MNYRMTARLIAIVLRFVALFMLPALVISLILGETGAVYQSIQTDFQTLEQLVTSLTGTGLGLLISNAQLLFGNTIETTEFLLFLQQCSIGGELAAAGLAMRTGRERTFYTRTFRIVPQALTDTTAQFVFGSTCGRHNSIPF